jgi:glutathione S-transferase
MTKPMFHYRWHYARDAAKASMLLPCWANENYLAGAEDELREAAQTIARRQIDRLKVVGSSPETKDMIEDSFVQFLRCFNAHLAAGYPFLLGDRPCAADFALYGHLNQLAFIDPTSMAVCESVAPRIFAW